MIFDYCIRLKNLLGNNAQICEKLTQMTKPAVFNTPTTRSGLRALNIEGDDAVRLKVTGLLQRLGCEVHACRDYAEAMQLFDGHEVVVGAVSIEMGDMEHFVEMVRAGSGKAQPFMLGISSGSGVMLSSQASDYGMDDVMPFPLDSERLTTRLSAIVREKSARPRRGVATAPHDGWTSPASKVLLEQLPAAVAVLDADLNYVAVNARWRREFQLHGLQLTGHSHYEIFPDLHDDWRKLYARCLNGHRERMEDDLLVRPDGTQDCVRWDIQPWLHPAGGIGGLILSCAIIAGDRHDKVQAVFEQNLVQSILNAPAALITVLDTGGRIVRLNAAAKALAEGHAITEGQTFFWNVLAPESRREQCRQRVLELLTLAAPRHQELWPLDGGPSLLTPAPDDHSVAWKALPHRRSDGTLEGLLLLGLESTKTFAPPPMSSEATTSPSAKSSAHDDDFRQIAEAAPFGMIVLNEEAELVYANPQHQRLLGFSVAECGGLTEWLERACAADEEFKRRALDEWWERVWRRHGAWTCSMRTVGGMVKELEFRPSQLPNHRLLLTVSDVTDSRLEDQALRASEARYRSLFQSCAGGVAVLNASGNITETNPAIEQLTGLNKLEMRRATLATFLPEDHATRIREAASRPDNAGSMGFITSLKAKDGTQRPVSLSFSVLKNEDGVPIYTSCFFHPLPAVSAPAPAPVESAWRSSDWSRAVPDCVLRIDAHGLILDHSDARDFASILPSGASISGMRLEDALPAIADLLPLDVMVDRLNENPSAETRCEFTTVLLPGGKPHSLEARMVSLPGDCPAYGLVLRDVSQAAGQAKTSASPADNAAAWVRNLHSPVIMSNERGRITSLNTAAEELLGTESAELEGSGLFRLFRPENPKSFSEEITAALTSERCWRARTPVHRCDGSTTEMLIELVPTYDEAAGPRGFIAILSDLPALAPPPAEEAPPRPVVTLHRARNDLQVLSSLLSLHADRSEDAQSRLAILAGKDRLTAVSLIYRLINGEQDAVDFARYTSELGRSLLDSRKIPADRVKIETAFDSIHLQQRVAISLGIILEELITSSLTEAFPDQTGGTIRISLTTGGDEGVLIVSDNGTLLSEALRSKRIGSFSWQVVQMLSEQISGVLTLLSDLENQVRLRFRLPGTAL